MAADGFTCAGPLIGSGPVFDFVFGLRWPDPAGPIYALVAVQGCFDLGDAALMAVDPVSGDRTVVSGGDASCMTLGVGPEMLDVEGLGWHPNGALLVTEDGNTRLTAVDPTTGTRTVVTGCSDFAGLPTCDPPSYIVGAGPLSYFLDDPFLVPEPSISVLGSAGAALLSLLARRRRREGPAA